jgi:hypothetical protein
MAMVPPRTSEKNRVQTIHSSNHREVALPPRRHTLKGLAPFVLYDSRVFCSERYLVWDGFVAALHVLGKSVHLSYLIKRRTSLASSYEGRFLRDAAVS